VIDHGLALSQALRKQDTPCNWIGRYSSPEAHSQEWLIVFPLLPAGVTGDKNLVWNVWLWKPTVDGTSKLGAILLCLWFEQLQYHDSLLADLQGTEFRLFTRYDVSWPADLMGGQLDKHLASDRASRHLRYAECVQVRCCSYC
jgi:hypothetical protein